MDGRMTPAERMAKARAARGMNKEVADDSENEFSLLNYIVYFEPHEFGFRTVITARGLHKGEKVFGTKELGKEWAIEEIKTLPVEL